MYNHFKIDVVQSSKWKSCSGCQEAFKLGEFQVMRCRQWHLDCYTPDFPTKIRLGRDVELSPEAEKHVDKLESWAEQWNQADLLKTYLLPETYFSNRVQRGKTPQHRLMLEVFKFLGAQEVELCASKVSLQWHRISRCSELWVEFFEGEFYPSPDIRKSIDVRSVYIQYAFQACWNCKHLVTVGSIQYVCPYHKKPLCVTCSELDTCQLMTQPQLRKSSGLSPAQMKTLDVPFFNFGVRKCTYLKLAKQKLNELREKRKAWLVKKLEQEQFVSAETLHKIRVLQPESPSDDVFKPVLKFLEALKPVALEKHLNNDYLQLKQALVVDK